MHPYLQKLKNRKTPISFPFFCNIPSVTCSHIPFVCIYYIVTLFVFEYVHKIIPDPPLVISPPLCRGFKQERLLYCTWSLYRLKNMAKLF